MAADERTTDDRPVVGNAPAEHRNGGEQMHSNRSRNNGQNQNKRRGSSWILGAAALFVVTKGKTMLSFLGKFAAPLLTMFASIGAYALLFPWGFAVGLVFMLLIHEIGHVLAARRKGLPVSAPVFIPFLGALINMKRHPRDAETEAYIAIGGPVLGTLGALAVFVLGLNFREEWGQTAELLLVIAQVGFFLNLINLLPIHPLDGGRISVAVTRWLWAAGLVGGLIVIVYLRSFLFFVIWALFAWELYQKYYKKKNEQPHLLEGTMEVPLEGMELFAPWLPGENHRSELPFTAYSSLADGEQKLAVTWPMFGVSRTFALPRQGIVKKVELVRVAREPEHFPQKIKAGLHIEYVPYEPDDYYDVPAAVRWKYGLAYAGLASFLGVMLYWLHALNIHI